MSTSTLKWLLSIFTRGHLKGDCWVIVSLLSADCVNASFTGLGGLHTNVELIKAFTVSNVNENPIPVWTINDNMCYHCSHNFNRMPTEGLPVIFHSMPRNVRQQEPSPLWDNFSEIGTVEKRIQCLEINERHSTSTLRILGIL